MFKNKKKQQMVMPDEINTDKVPKMPGVNTFWNFEFLEKRQGKRDAQENQVCRCDGGHITPYVNDKCNCFDSYVDKAYLIVSRRVESIVMEANALVIELNLILAAKSKAVTESGEEGGRQAMMAAAAVERNETRRKEILERIAEIRAQSDMIDESLKHHIERAEGILHARLSKYWRGVLQSFTEDELEYFPQVFHRESDGRKAYTDNRTRLLDIIDSAINYGGAAYET